LIGTNQSTLFPEPAARGGYQLASRWKFQERTFSVEPQKRATGLPFDEDTPFEKPLGSLLAMGTTCDVLVDRGIRRREPFAKVLPQLIPWEDD
jgi:hypothetical protein